MPINFKILPDQKNKNCFVFVWLVDQSIKWQKIIYLSFSFSWNCPIITHIFIIIHHRNMNSKEGATLLTMQRPKNSQKKEDMT